MALYYRDSAVQYHRDGMALRNMDGPVLYHRDGMLLYPIGRQGTRTAWQVQCRDSAAL